MSALVTRPGTKPAAPAFDVARVRRDFPILRTTVRGHPLVYLDNGATTQKPQAVIDAVLRCYSQENANIHRGVYELSREATAAYEEARERVAKFLNASQPRECIFTRGTTESINLVASSWGRTYLKPGDEILLTTLEHHSNIVPWQLACEQTGAKIRVCPINNQGELLLDEFQKLLGPRTKMVAVTHVSNALGTIIDVKQLAKLAHAAGALILVDGAQWVAHFPTDVQDLDVDFYAFSGHKLFGPTGIGVLYGKQEWLDRMPPYQGGGDMVDRVTFEKTTYADLPAKFEAGTPNIAGTLGLRAAIDYILDLSFEQFAEHEEDLLRHATKRLGEIEGLRLIGTAKNKAGVVSFLMEHPCVAPLDVGAALDLEGIAVRTGHHCCQPLMDRFKIPGTVRVSFSYYNTIEEIDRTADALLRLRKRRLAETPKCAERVELATRAEPQYPPASAATPEAAAQKLIDAFEFLGDWRQRYEYLIDIGRKLLPLPAEERTEANRVHGCQSQVWLAARKHPGSTDVMDFLADSDAEIVRGLIALLQKVFSGQKAAAILSFNIAAFFRALGLEEHLAMTRRNGLAEMVKRIRNLAKAIVESHGQCTGECASCANEVDLA